MFWFWFENLLRCTSSRGYNSEITNKPIFVGYGSDYAKFCNGCGVLLCDTISLTGHTWELMPIYLLSPLKKEGLCVKCALIKLRLKYHTKNFA